MYIGHLERYSTARNPLGFYTNVAVAATYTLPETYSLPLKDYIYKACETQIAQHPILSAIPLNEDRKDTYFARLPEVNLTQCVLFQERTKSFPSEEDERDEELDGLLKGQHKSPFSAPLPYWRLCVLTDPSDGHRFTAVFVYHHAVGDGGSGPAFHRTFLRALTDAQSISASDVKTVVASSKTPLLPNMEQVHPMPMSTFFLLREWFKTKFWKSARDPGLWTGSKVTLPLETNVKHLVISKRDTTALKDACRKHSTTITGAVQALVASALFANLPDHATKLRCEGAISSRRWLTDDRITDDSLGVWVQDYSDNYQRSSFPNQGEFGFPWAEARRSKEHLHGILASKGKNAQVYLLKHVDDFHKELFLAKLDKERGGSFEVSNIGVFRAPEEGGDSPRIGRVVFSQSATVAGPAFEVSVITGADGCLVLTLSWQKGIVEDELIEAVMEAVRTELVGLKEK